MSILLFGYQELVENNPVIAVEVLIKPANSPEIEEYVHLFTLYYKKLNLISVPTTNFFYEMQVFYCSCQYGYEPSFNGSG